MSDENTAKGKARRRLTKRVTRELQKKGRPANMSTVRKIVQQRLRGETRKQQRRDASRAKRG